MEDRGAMSSARSADVIDSPGAIDHGVELAGSHTYEPSGLTVKSADRISMDSALVDRLVTRNVRLTGWSLTTGSSMRAGATSTDAYGVLTSALAGMKERASAMLAPNPAPSVNRAARFMATWPRW